MALLLPSTIYHRGTNSDTAVHENTHPLRTQNGVAPTDGQVTWLM